MGDVVDLDCATTLDIDPAKVLTAAAEAGLESAIVIGWDSQSRLYLASSTSEIGGIILLLELAKRELLAQ